MWDQPEPEPIRLNTITPSVAVVALQMHASPTPMCVQSNPAKEMVIEFSRERTNLMQLMHSIFGQDRGTAAEKVQLKPIASEYYHLLGSRHIRGTLLCLLRWLFGMPTFRLFNEAGWPVFVCPACYEINSSWLNDCVL